MDVGLGTLDCAAVVQDLNPSGATAARCRMGLALYLPRVRSSDLLGGRPLHLRIMHFSSKRMSKPCAKDGYPTRPKERIYFGLKQ